MNSQWYEAVIRNRSVLEPLPTEAEPKLENLPGIKAVIFDVYGTLVVSGSGDVGAADGSDRGDKIGEALLASGIRLDGVKPPSIEDLHREIRRSNEARLSDRCPKPEVDIVESWRQTLIGCGIDVSTEQCNRLAAEYESRANPTWPMPGAETLLERLSQSELKRGIVSNAQGFTLSLVSNLVGQIGGDLVFDPNLCVFSNRYRQAKPGPRLFGVLCDGLTRVGIRPEESIYVGNDRLNDVWAASQAGMRTAWFAGDRRSMRTRDEDPRLATLGHDIVLTELTQLLDCLPAV